MRIERIPASGWGERLQAEWSTLLDETEEASVFLSPEWLMAWRRHFGAGREAFAVAGRDESGRLVGFAALYKRRFGPGALRGPWILSFVGDEGVGSEYLGFLSRKGTEQEFALALARELEGDWALVDFRSVRKDLPRTRLLIDALATPAPGRVHGEASSCSSIPLPGDYETYLASLASKFRTTLRYRTNKLVKNFCVRLVRTSRHEDLDAHLERLFEMHQGRWEAEGHPGSFYHPCKRAFYREVSAAFLRRGWLRFYHLEVDGVIRAAQFGFAFGGVLHSLQEAFDYRFRPAGVGGIGVVLRGMAIRESIAEGLKGYDFLEGEEDFKTRWGTQTHEVEHVRIGAPGPLGGFAYVCTAGWRDAKLWLRARLPKRIVEARDRFRVRRQARRAQALQAGAQETDR